MGEIARIGNVHPLRISDTGARAIAAGFEVMRQILDGRDGRSAPPRRTAEEIRADHDRELAAMTDKQRAVVRRAQEVGRRSAMCAQGEDQLLAAVCRREARWQNTDVVA
jgi:hypothetical protein